MRTYENITRLNFKRGRRSYRLLAFIISLTVIFFIFINAFFDSVAKTQEVQRQDTYGAWHFAAYKADRTVQQRLANHATVKQYGEMKVYGQVTSSNLIARNLGTMDPAAGQLGQIKLAAGEYPSQPDEIVVEKSVLASLGYTASDIGSSIELPVRFGEQANGTPLMLQQRYRLSGVLVDYTALWKDSGRSLLSFIVASVPEVQTPMFINVFCEIKNTYLDNIGELTALVKGQSYSAVNDYTYHQLSPLNDRAGDKNNQMVKSSDLRLILLAIATFIIFTLLADSLKNRSRGFIFMRSIGATKGQIIRLYSGEIASITAFGILSGIAGGSAVSWLIWMVLRSLLQCNAVFVLRLDSLLANAAMVCGGVLIAFLCSLVQFNSIKVVSTPQYRISADPRSRRRKVNRPLGTLRIVKAFNQAHRSETNFALIIMCCTCTALAWTSYYTFGKFQYLKALGVAAIGEERRWALIQVIFCLIVLVLIIIIMLVVFIFVWRGGTALPLQIIRQRLQNLYRLGMRKRQLMGIHIANTVLFSLYASVISILVVMGFHIVSYFQIEPALGANGTLALFWDAVAQFFTLLPWQAVIGFILSFLFVNICVAILPVIREFYCITKKDK